ncbi:MAG: hypothetical protein HY286_08495 [Planctomycetes bacterium]|nr:hypothetical protein [Planctomycetota bacterium]
MLIFLLIVLAFTAPALGTARCSICCFGSFFSAAKTQTRKSCCNRGASHEDSNPGKTKMPAADCECCAIEPATHVGNESPALPDSPGAGLDAWFVELTILASRRIAPSFVEINYCERGRGHAPPRMLMLRC